MDMKNQRAIRGLRPCYIFSTGVFLLVFSCIGARAQGTPVWQETFDGRQPGPLIEQGGGIWHVDEQNGEGPEGFDVVEAPDGGNALAIRKHASSSRLRMRLGIQKNPYVATDSENNRVSVTFREGKGASAPLVITFFAGRGGTQVASLKLDLSGGIVLFREKMQKQPETLPFEWTPGEWNRVDVTVFPGKQEVVIRVAGEDGKPHGKFSAPLVREESSDVLPWYVLHFSQTSISDAPWLVRSVTLGDGD